jgi:pheromone shutdown protein TraB
MAQNIYNLIQKENIDTLLVTVGNAHKDGISKHLLNYSFEKIK